MAVEWPPHIVRWVGKDEVENRRRTIRRKTKRQICQTGRFFRLKRHWLWKRSWKKQRLYCRNAQTPSDVLFWSHWVFFFLQSLPPSKEAFHTSKRCSSQSNTSLYGGNGFDGPGCEPLVFICVYSKARSWFGDLWRVETSPMGTWLSLWKQGDRVGQSHYKCISVCLCGHVRTQQGQGSVYLGRALSLSDSEVITFAPNLPLYVLLDWCADYPQSSPSMLRHCAKTQPIRPSVNTPQNELYVSHQWLKGTTLLTTRDQGQGNRDLVFSYQR